MKDKELEKNLLDLKHSLSLTKAGTFLALAFSSWIAIFFSIKEFYSDRRIAIYFATLIATVFLYYAIKFFRKCDGIYEEIKNL